MGEATHAAARSYRELGFSVIPICDGEKRPAVKWQEYQSRIATEEELERWFLQTDISNLAIVTGQISSLTVVDVDPRNGGERSLLKLPPLGQATVKTGGGGWHYYFIWRDGDCRPGILPGIDIKSNGGYVLAPPSETNGKYSFCSTSGPVRRQWDEGLIRELFSQDKPVFGGKAPTFQGGPSLVPFQQVVFHPVPPGSRNISAARLFGKLLYGGVSLSQARTILRMWNSELPVPLDREELERVMDSIESRHRRKHST